MNCYFCNESLDSSAQADPLIVTLTKQVEPLSSAHKHFWNAPNEPEAYQANRTYHLQFHDELGATVCVSREVFPAGRIIPPRRLQIGPVKHYAKTLTETLETNLVVQFLRCRRCEVTRSKNIKRALIGAMVGTAAISALVMGLTIGWTYTAMVLAFFLWLFLAAFAFFILKDSREELSDRMSAHPVVRSAKQEGFFVNPIEDGIFGRNISNEKKNVLQLR